MSFASIRVRLTAWYLVMLALGLGVFGIGSWFAMRASAFHTIDEELEDRIRGVEKFMQLQIASLSPVEIRDEFREHSVLGPGGDLFQVCDEKGQWLYRSAVLENNRVPIRLPTQLGDEPIYENISVQDIPIRFATGRVVVNDHPYTIQVAAPLKEFYEALERFRLILWLSVPLLLTGAGLGGYLISRRALKPVDQITTAAESISISNLSDRLEVPKTSDELQRLSETLNRMLARLDASVQRMSQLTADASHELRAPVSLIRTTAELAIRGGRTNPEYHDDMVQILTEAERTSKLIDSLLLLARADSGAAGLQHELSDISISVREAMEQARASATEKRTELTADFDSSALVVRGDGEALRRLFFILIDNAIKYTPEGGRVRIRVEASDGQTTIKVTDSGIGISESDLPHIFDRFWRADKVRSRGAGGAGLGLSIARWIVDQHRGAIEVQSEPGQGSTFTVRIPLANLEAPSEQS
ncbi:MAG: HAMP domain-containing histidine kinase [Acidobacteriia bacterium]|nr:HAMP domain-containing histidine kinase [Terriglobia bacterium]